MTSDVTLTSALNQQQRTAGASTKLAEDFTQFLNLLTVQLQHQDPLSPMDTTEFTNQLVAFTGVEQQINTNQKLDALVAMNLSSSLSSAQNYVGSNVSYVSSEFNYAGGSTPIKYSLDSAAASAKINILDESGQVVYSEAAGKTTGIQTFNWDGTTKTGQKAPPGTYQVRVDALDDEDVAIKSTIVVSGKVRGTETQDGQIYLLVGERAVPLANVLNTSKTGANNSNTEALNMALNYVGLDVSYPNTHLDYSGTGSKSINYSLPKQADRAKVQILDESGDIVFSGDIAKSKGSNTYTWTGRLDDGTQAPAGEYTFKIDAIGSDDKRIEAASVAKGRVTGVETLDGEISVIVGGRSVPITDILSATQPTTA